MSVFSVRVTRVLAEDSYVDLLVRARSCKAAGAKALRLTRANADQWLGPIDSTSCLSAGDIEEVEGPVDTEVL